MWLRHHHLKRRTETKNEDEQRDRERHHEREDMLVRRRGGPDGRTVQKQGDMESVSREHEDAERCCRNVEDIPRTSGVHV